jgi:hypothetical protein
MELIDLVRLKELPSYEEKKKEEKRSKKKRGSP